MGHTSNNFCNTIKTGLKRQKQEAIEAVRKMYEEEERADKVLEKEFIEQTKKK